ncbi:MAG: hypothetical protein PHS54_00100 [Clostridia bacterium]|nr:hypothetical protein [Clostridia bacterium]
MNKAILYYSHNSLPIEMEEFFQKKLLDNSDGVPIISIIKNARTDFCKTFAHANIIVENKYHASWGGILYQMEQGIDYILKEFDDCIVYLAEHDVLYPPSYFSYIPDNDKRFLKNYNLYFVNREGFIGPHNYYIHSQTIGYASLFKYCINEDVKNIQKFKSKKGYDLKSFISKDSCLDIRHGYNWTGYREIEKNSEKNYIMSLPYWGDHNKLISQIPGFKYE